MTHFRGARTVLFLAIAGLAVLTLRAAITQRGPARVFAPDIKILAIPSFLNQTHTYHVETSLTDAVIREFNTRTRYRVVSVEGNADAVLQGTVFRPPVASVADDSVTGRASTGLVTIIAKVTLTARMAACSQQSNSVPRPVPDLE